MERGTSRLVEPGELRLPRTGPSKPDGHGGERPLTLDCLSTNDEVDNELVRIINAQRLRDIRAALRHGSSC